VLAAPARWIRWLTVHQWRAIDRETGPTGPTGGFDWRVLVVLVTCCVVLTLQEYVGGRDVFADLWPNDRTDRYWQLKSFGWWTAWRVGGYLVLPMLVILCMPGERLRDYYISLRGVLGKLWIYALMFGLILPAVIQASQHEGFYRTYPFYKWANRSSFDFWTWQLMYAAQFLSLEFFFRAFLLQGLRRSLGSNAIFVMVIPYCMIHYGKPMAETFGAIGAGLILGTLAMRTRSIWGGVLIHVGVALTMDLLALGHCPPAESGRQCPSD
jgi:membrane protease YdiL (CAAX protease family)